MSPAPSLGCPQGEGDVGAFIRLEPQVSGSHHFARRPNAADYVTKLPKKESDLPEWQTAIEVLMLCSRGGPTMMARMGMMKAPNRHVEQVFKPGRKETHWGKRKLKRDQ